MRLLARNLILACAGALIFWLILMAFKVGPTMFEQNRTRQVISAIEDKIDHWACILRNSCAAAPTSMFEQDRAKQAFAVIQDRIGHKVRVFTLTIKPDELTAEIPNPDKPGETETWTVTRADLLGVFDFDTVSRHRSQRAQIINGTLNDNLIDVDADGLAMVPKLAAAALNRARLQQSGQVKEMELHRVPNIVTGGVTEPSWRIHLQGIDEDADIYAKITGEITILDLDRTKRVRNLNLLAAGPDFDELAQNIRSEIGSTWTFHYIEIEKKQIDFDVTLNTVKNPRTTRFRATFNGIKTDAMSMPHVVFPGDPTDDPFSLDDVDLNLLSKLEDAALRQLQIAKGVVARVIVSRPHRERGGAVEWEVQVNAGNAPIFWNPSLPKPEEGSVVFDTKGNILRTKYPEGRGPQTNLFDGVSLAKAIGKIGERLGPHLKLIELVVYDKTIDITAQDPQNPKKFAAFVYENEEVSRASGASQTVANALAGGPDWLWDLALLQPSVLQSIPVLEKQTMARLNMTHGAIERITISKDKIFRPANDKVLIEIRASGDGKDSDWVTFDLTGVIPRLDPPISGIRVVGPQGNVKMPAAAALASSPEDEDDCTRSLEPDKIIPACTRMAEDRTDTPHNRAVAYYDRGNAYKTLKDYDRALADYSDALKLDPRYAHAYLNRGYVYVAKNDADHALADFNRSIQLDPTQVDAYFNRGLVYRWLRKFEPAIADFDAAIKINVRYAAAYEARGFAYQLQGNLDRALSDYGEVIRLDPKFVAAYNDRGSAYRLKGDFDRAIEDHTWAIRLEPNAAMGYERRGYVQYLAGRLPQALADLTQANAISPSNAYVVLLLDIAGQRSNLPSRLDGLSSKVDMRAWPAPVFRLYLGQMTTDSLLAAADDLDPVKKRGKVCEANFYTGELALIRGKKDDAAKLFTAASSDCPLNWTEWEFANVELKALGVTPPAQPRR